MLFQELSKIKTQSIMASLTLVAFGIIMILCPESYTASLIDAMGFAMVIVAMLLVLRFFDGRKRLIDFILLTLALVAMVLGLVILVFNDGESMILHILGWLFAMVLVLHGLYSMVHTFVYARRAHRPGWWVLVILGLILIACGVVIIVNFYRAWWTTPDALLSVIGIMLIFASLVGIIRTMLVWPIRREEEA